MGRFAILLLLLAADPTKPGLVLRASPRLSIAPIATGCSTVLLIAEIRGPEDEAWYCPEVRWEWPDGTSSVTESDCPVFEARDACIEPQTGCGGWHRGANGAIVDNPECPCTVIGYPRRWTRRVCMPPNPEGQAWIITVRLARDKRTIARESVNVIVR